MSDFKSFLSVNFQNAILTIAIAAASILWVELVRDFYHALSHVWQPLYKLHVWHHKVFRRDLSVVSNTIYRQAHWYNDVPEALVMQLFSLIPWWLTYNSSLNYQIGAWLGILYTFSFLMSAIARGVGLPYADEITDLTHRQGDFESIPSRWLVNRPYHWRHHFDNQNAYFCGTFTFVDKLMGTALSLKGKKVAVTGTSGSLGRSLLKYLHLNGAKVTALTSSDFNLELNIEGENIPLNTIRWEVGKEFELLPILEKIDILIINHGINVHGERSAEAIERSYQINTFSSSRLLDIFFQTVRNNEDIVKKEVWINTSEAEVNPAFSPVYELTKRALGNLVTLRRLDAPCTVRKIILGPFKSNLNPIGIMSADWVAKQVINSAKRDIRNIIVTINPLTFLFFPVKEFLVSAYFKLFTKSLQDRV
jgi:monoglucosyldiacylglycerol epimerase